jgi:hypothetical protein
MDIPSDPFPIITEDVNELALAGCWPRVTNMKPAAAYNQPNHTVQTILQGSRYNLLVFCFSNIQRRNWSQSFYSLRFRAR